MPRFSPPNVRIFLTIFIFLFFAFVSYWFFASRPTLIFAVTDQISNVNYAPVVTGPWLQVGKTKIPVELATSSQAIQQGLSGRFALAKDKGMLFIFSAPSRYRFWMPNMHFPLDFVWIGSNKQIVDITSNVSNQFDPAKPAFYRPSQPTQYVLEVNAGFAQEHKLKIGDQLIFKNFR